MWFLFAAVAVALSGVVAYGWGLAKGAELTRGAQARLYDALRGAVALAIAAHARERAARQSLELAAQSSMGPATDRSLLGEAGRAAELASRQTEDALARLSAALGEDAAPHDRAPHNQAPRSAAPMGEPMGEKGSSET